MPIGIPLLTIELVKAAPNLMESGRKIYETMSGWQQKRSSDGAPKGDGVPALRAAVAGLQGRIDSVEERGQGQGEWNDQMARRLEGLRQWVMALTVVALFTSGVAIAALVVVLIQ